MLFTADFLWTCSQSNMWLVNWCNKDVFIRKSGCIKLLAKHGVMCRVARYSLLHYGRRCSVAKGLWTVCVQVSWTAVVSSSIRKVARQDKRRCTCVLWGRKNQAAKPSCKRQGLDTTLSLCSLLLQCLCFDDAPWNVYCYLGYGELFWTACM